MYSFTVESKEFKKRNLLFCKKKKKIKICIYCFGHSGLIFSDIWCAFSMCGFKSPLLQEFILELSL